MRHERVGEHIDHVDRLQLAGDPDGEALACELVDDVEHPDLAAVMGAVLDEVVGPDVVAMLGPEPGAGAIVEPQAAPLRLLGRHLEPLASPDPLAPLGVHNPARIAQQGRDPAITIATILSGQRDDVGHEQVFVISAPRRRTVLSERHAHAALEHGQMPSHMLDADAPTRGAQ